MTSNITINTGSAKSTNSVTNLRKRIKITSRGVLTTKGGAHGPITSPYMETLANIKNLIARDRAVVIEVLPDKEVTLTLKNYYLDNSVEVVTEEADTTVVPTEVVPDPTPAPVVTPVLTPPNTSSISGSNNNQNNRNNNNNRNNAEKAKNTDKVETPSDTADTTDTTPVNQ